MDNPMAAGDPVRPARLGGHHSHGSCGCGGEEEQKPQTETNQTEVGCAGEGCQPGDPVTAADVEELLRDVVDPELGINVVDLGLVYGVTISPGEVIDLDMTLTSAACPLTDVIQDQVNQALESVSSAVNINWVWLPPWGPERITELGREQLRALGYNV